MSTNLAARRRSLLDLTIRQHGLKRRIDLERAAIDEAIRQEYADTGEAPTYKTKGLGTVRLDVIGGGPTPEVVDQAAFDSYVAERFPSESTATITLPADQLEAALEVLGFAEVTVHRSEVHTNAVSAAAVLGDLTIIDSWEDLADDEHPAEDDTRYEVFDNAGASVPGVGVRVVDPTLKLVVTADPAAKSKACDEADAEAAAAAEQPIDEETADEETADEETADEETTGEAVA